MELFIIRHTPVAVDSTICYGQSDVELNDQFDHYFNLYKNNLPSTFDKVFSSPLKRCSTLAKALTQTEITEDNRLMEMNFGDWELKSWNDIPMEESKNWTDNFDIVKTPQGESLNDLFNRIQDFYNELKEQNFKNVLIVTHAGPIRCFWANILEISLKNSFKIPVGFGEILTINTEHTIITRKS